MAKLDVEFGSKGFRAVQKEVTQLDKDIELLRRENIKLNKQLKELDKTTENYEKQEKALTKAIVDNTVKIKENQRSQKTLNREMAQSTKGISNVTKAVGVLGVAFGSLALKDVIVDISNTGREFESLRASLNASVGGVVQGADAMQFLRKEANRLGIDLLSTTQGFKELSASAKGTSLASGDIRNVFTAVAEAGKVMQLSTDDLNGTFRALSQIMSKGTVQAEELKGQIGERIPGAFQIASRAMGVTTQELGKMLQNGEVLSDEFLPKFAEELKKTFSKDVEGAVDTLASSQSRFNNALRDTKVAIAESGLNSLVGTFTDIGTSFLRSLEQIINADKTIAELKGIKQLEDRLESLNKQQSHFNDLIKAQPQLATVYQGNLSQIGERISTVNRLIKEQREQLELKKVEEEKQAETQKEKVEQQKKVALAEKKRLETLKQIDKQEKENLSNARLYEQYYEDIGNYSKAWLEKEKQLRVQFKNLEKSEVEKLIKIRKDKYFKALDTERKKDLKAHNKAQEEKKNALQRYTDSVGTSYEQIDQLAEVSINSLDRGLTDFFDRQSDNWLDFGNLAESVLSDIARQATKTAIVQPATQAIGGFTKFAVESIGDYFGFANGGYTGDGGKYDVAGVVHKGEYVVPKHLVEPNKDVLAGIEAQRQGKKGYFFGGSVDSVSDFGSFKDLERSMGLDRVSDFYSGDGGDSSFRGTYTSNSGYLGGGISKNDYLNLSPANQIAYLENARNASGALISGATDRQQRERLGMETFGDYTQKAVSAISSFLGGTLGKVLVASISASPIAILAGGLLGKGIGKKGGELINEELEVGDTIDNFVDSFSSVNIDIEQSKTIGAVESLQQSQQNFLDFLEIETSGGGGLTFGEFQKESAKLKTEVDNKVKELNQSAREDLLPKITDLYESIFGAVPETINQVNKDWLTELVNFSQSGASGIIDEVLFRGSNALFGGASDTNLLALWQQRATESGTDVLGAIRQSRQGLRDYTLSQLQPTARANQSLLYKQADFDLFAQSLGFAVGEITNQNFLEQYDKATKENFTPETFDNWNNLSKLLIDVNTAQEAYNKSLSQTVDTFNNLKASTIGSLRGEEANRLTQLSLFNQAISTFEGAKLSGNEGLIRSSTQDIFKIGRSFAGTSLAETIANRLQGINLNDFQGFSNGGYTGVGGKYQVAGLVHRNEYVVNSDQLKSVGGAGNLETMLKNGNSGMNKTMSGLVAQNAQLTKDINKLLKLFERLTNNGDRMSCELTA